MRIALAFAAALVLMAPAPAPETYSYEIAGQAVFSMTHPDGWIVDTEHDADEKLRPAGADPMPQLVAARPDVGKLWYGTWVVDKIDDFDDAEHYLGSLTEHLFDDVEVGTFETGLHHGMDFRYYEGTAVYLQAESTASRRENVDFFAAFFKPSDHGVGIALYVGLPSATAQYRDVLTQSLQSIRPASDARGLDQ